MHTLTAWLPALPGLPGSAPAFRHTCRPALLCRRKLQLQYNHIAGVTGEPFLQSAHPQRPTKWGPRCGLYHRPSRVRTCCPASLLAADVEDFDLSSNDLQRLPLDAVAAAPRLRALRLAGHADLSVTPDDIRSLAALAPRLELLVSRGRLPLWNLPLGASKRWVACAHRTCHVHPCAGSNLPHALPPPVQDLRGARMWPSEAALLARELPQVELLLDGVEGQWLHGYVPPFREHVEWADWVAAAEDAASDDGAGPAREPYAGA